MSKHTPGPWIIADDGTIEAKHLGRVGFLTHAAPADAALIAAAPEMYEALKGILYEFPDDAEDPFIGLQSARAAIAKAEGRS